MALRSPTITHNDWGIFVPGGAPSDNLPNVSGSPTQSASLEVGDTATVSTAPPTKYICTDATVGAATWALIATGSGSAGQGPFSRVLYVDAIRGDNGTAVPGDDNLPYQTIGAALSAAASNDTILVGPGTYGSTDFGLGPSSCSIIGQGTALESVVIDSAGAGPSGFITTAVIRNIVGLTFVRNVGGVAFEANNLSAVVNFQNCVFRGAAGQPTTSFTCSNVTMLDCRASGSVNFDAIDRAAIIDNIRAFNVRLDMQVSSGAPTVIVKNSILGTYAVTGGASPITLGINTSFELVDENAAGNSHTTQLRFCYLDQWFPSGASRSDAYNCVIGTVIPAVYTGGSPTINLYGTTVLSDIQGAPDYDYDLRNTSMVRSQIAAASVNANIIDSQALTAYIDPVAGNDDSGQVDNPNAPFGSIDAAMAKVPAPNTLVLAEGNYQTNGITFSSTAPCAIRARAGKVVIGTTGATNLVQSVGGGSFSIEGDIQLDGANCSGYALFIPTSLYVYIDRVTFTPGLAGSVFGGGAVWWERDTRLSGSWQCTANEVFLEGSIDDLTGGTRTFDGPNVYVESGLYESLVVNSSGGIVYFATGVECRQYSHIVGQGTFHGTNTDNFTVSAPYDLNGARLGTVVNIGGSGNVFCRGTVFTYEPTISPTVVAVNAPRTFTNPALGSYTLLPTTSEVIGDVTTTQLDFQLPDPSTFFGSVRFATTTALGNFPVNIIPFSTELIDDLAGTYTINPPTTTPIGFVLISNGVNWSFAATRGF